MSTNEAAGEVLDAALPPTSPRKGADSPGLLPAILIVLCLFVVVLVPAVLSVLTPQRPAGTIGFYERVTLSLGAGITTTSAGFIAPEGWVWPDEADNTVFATVDGAVRISSSLLVDVDDPASALRGVTPVGAAFVPTHSFTTESGLDGLFVDYDMAAGDQLSRDIVACAASTPTCVHFNLEFTNFSPAVLAEADRAIEQIINSMEVL